MPSSWCSIGGHIEIICGRSDHWLWLKELDSASALFSGSGQNWHHCCMGVVCGFLGPSQDRMPPPNITEKLFYHFAPPKLLIIK